MTGAEITAAASDFSVVSLVCLVMMGGCAFGIAIGYPWHWIVAAAVLFLVASGYVGSGLAVAATTLTVRRFAPQCLAWLEKMHIGAGAERRANVYGRYRSDAGGDRGSRARRNAHADGRDRYSYEDMFGAGARRDDERPAEPVSPKGASPESILGLGSRFSMKDLDKARRRLAKKFHPDLHRRASVKKQRYMAEKMRAVNSAYEALKGQVA